METGLGCAIFRVSWARSPLHPHTASKMSAFSQLSFMPPCPGSTGLFWHQHLLSLVTGEISELINS